MPVGGLSRTDDRGRIVFADALDRVLRYDSRARQDPTLRGSLPRIPGKVTFSSRYVGFGADGRIVVGGFVDNSLLPAVSFAALLPDGRLDRAYGAPAPLRARKTRLERRIVPVRVHCAADAQRRCVVRASAGSRLVRVFVAPGADRVLRVPVTGRLARAIRRSGRREVRLRLRTIDENVRIQDESVSVVVRR